MHHKIRTHNSIRSRAMIINMALLINDPPTNRQGIALCESGHPVAPSEDSSVDSDRGSDHNPMGEGLVRSW